VNWLAPAVGYIAAVSVLGISGKLALRTLDWQDLVPWTAAAYFLTATVLVTTGQARLGWSSGTGWAIASAGLAVAALMLLYAALSAGEASKVVPVTAAYPALTLVLSAAFLSEQVSPARIAGTVLVVGGVVLLTAAR
jgi:bacterial/archaeal transporter family protein